MGGSTQFSVLKWGFYESGLLVVAGSTLIMVGDPSARVEALAVGGNRLFLNGIDGPAATASIQS